MVKLRIAIILARGGSKRLPRKNLRLIGGCPMLVWSVRAAIDSGCFDRVLVSTDDAEIATVGRDAGAEVPFFRDAAVDDFAPSSQATLVALRQAEAYWNERYDVVAQLMANCPLRTAGDICDASEIFDASPAPAQISVFRFGWMNPWWAVRMQDDGRPSWLFPEAQNMRSQDLPHLYCPSGALWIARREPLLESRNFYMEGHVLHPMEWMSAMDIDDADDFMMAEACMDLRRKIQI